MIVRQKILLLIVYVSLAHGITPLADQITLTPEEQVLFNTYSFDELFARGRACKVAGEVTQAIQYLKPAVLKRPRDWPANWDLGDMYLAQGDFARGLAGFRFRWQHEQLYKTQLWRGEDLSNKTILVYCQWGFGDTFMYLRYLAELKKLGATVICCVQKPLVNIVSYCPFIDRVITSNDTKPAFDYQVPITYLPEVFNTTIDTIPHQVPYMFVDDQYIQQWAPAGDSKKALKIGICWQGALREDAQTANRSIKLLDLLPVIAIPGVEIYSLQQGYGADQIEDLPKNYHIVTFGENFDKGHGAFVDTAAVIKNLDLVLTIDTSIAHLAGALGVPVWVMLQYASEWRFFLNRSDSPWYPTMRLFRQTQQSDWSPVIQEVVHALHIN
ncbi:MAG: hypothetical protein WC707_01765 [Candidatus Babeliaceae bacterium]|jgi:hypothetical protein